MAPKFVAPYRMSGKRGKNDAADAAAICEAVTRPNMRFVPVKDVDQQAILCLHRTRQGFVEERTALYNRLRGLISEFGIVLPQKVERLRREIGAHLEELPGWANRCVGDLLVHADRLNERIDEYDRAIAQAARQDARSRQLMQLPGIGPTTASALVASLGGGHDFKNGRQLAAWVGLVPGQYSSGGKARLGRITKAGDAYLRSLLVMGARVSPRRLRRASRTASVAGHAVWLNDAATGKPLSPSPPRTCGCPGRCMKYGDDFRLTAAIA